MIKLVKSNTVNENGQFITEYELDNGYCNIFEHNFSVQTKEQAENIFQEFIKNAEWNFIEESKMKTVNITTFGQFKGQNTEALSSFLSENVDKINDNDTLSNFIEKWLQQENITNDNYLSNVSISIKANDEIIANY